MHTQINITNRRLGSVTLSLATEYKLWEPNTKYFDRFWKLEWKNVIANLFMFVFFLFSQGTNISAGKCRGIVIGTGLNTEIGEYLCR